MHTHYVRSLMVTVQRFDQHGQRFTNAHYYYYYYHSRPTWQSRKKQLCRKAVIFAVLLLRVLLISHSSAPVQNSKQVFSCQLHIIQYGLQQQQQSHKKHGRAPYLDAIRYDMSCMAKSPPWRTEGSDVKDISAENLEMLYAPLVMHVVFHKVYLSPLTIHPAVPSGVF